MIKTCYYAIIDKWYDTYIGDDNKKHRKYYTNIIHYMEGGDPMKYIENINKLHRHQYSYIWSFCTIK